MTRMLIYFSHAHLGHRVAMTERPCGCYSAVCHDCAEELHRWCKDAPHLSPSIRRSLRRKVTERER